MKQIETARKIVEATKTRSAWSRGVKEYALELIESIEERSNWDDVIPATRDQWERWLLNGASNWGEYSWGGCSLVYNRQIAERLCTATELKRTDNGRRGPNNIEQWPDTQARALYQACELVLDALMAAS